MAGFLFLFLEREHLLSRIPADRTVGFRRSKKESCPTLRELRVNINLVEFRPGPGAGQEGQLPRALLVQGPAIII